MRNDASDVTQGLATPAWVVLVVAIYRWVVIILYTAVVYAVVAHACRRSLAKLDDRLLNDIGFTRDQARAESLKGFWD